MRSRYLWVAVAAVFALPLSPFMGRSLAQEAAVAEEGVEVLTRGPVHEAFVETVVFKPTPGIFAPKAAPALIEELPPEQRPEGDRVQWIPGYWSWDDETTEFIWVSGIWRNIPPGRQWIPGYWQEAADQWQWVSGYWANASVEEVEYLPEPPANVKESINIKQRPSEDSVWIPGNWAYRDDRYLWSGGYWENARPNWLWMPAHYNWSPYGYVYVDGYWDYSMPYRGMAFAPVRFAPSYYGRAGYHYTPAVTIALDLLVGSLFVRPHYHHYYFGDYYGANYQSRGYYGYNTYYSGGYGYDPIYAHQRWSNRHDGGWERRVAQDFAFYRDNSELRPPRTYSAYQAYASNPDVKTRFARNFAAPLATVATRQDRPLKLKSVNEAERQQFATSGREVRDFGNRWKKAAPEAALTPTTERPAGDKSARVEPKRVRVPKSPMVAKLPEATSTADTPPPAPKASNNPKLRPGGKGGRVPDNTVEPGETPKVAPGETPKVTPAPGEETKRNPKSDPKLRPGRDPSSEPPPAPRETPGETPRQKTKENPSDTPKETPRVTPKETPRSNPKERPGRDPSSEPPPAPRETPGETPRQKPKENPSDTPKETPRVTPKVTPKVEPSTPAPEPKARPKSNPKSESRESPRPTPKVERVSPQPSPKVQPSETRPMPKAAPRPQPQPKVAPQPKPSAPAPRSKPSPSNPTEEEKEKGKGKKNR